jgi:hypothetical protein
VIADRNSLSFIGPLRKENHRALDHFRDSFGLMALRNRQFLHIGRVYSRPPCHRHCGGADQRHLGAKGDLVPQKLTDETDQHHRHPFDPAWDCVSHVSRFHVHTREKVVDIGPIEATAERKKTVPLPPLLGGLAVVGGAALLLVGAKK